MTQTRKTEQKIDWSAADAMTAEERHAAAMADPDAKPIRPEDLPNMPRVPPSGRRAPPGSWACR